MDIGTFTQVHPLRVLLIDDDQDEYVLLREMVARAPEGWSLAGFDLKWVSRYEDAIRAVSECKFHVYLLDYALGEHSGLDVLRETMNRSCSAPIIMLTGHESQEVDMAAMQLGASGYLVKSELSLPLLERSIRYALERTQIQSDLSKLVRELNSLQKATSSLLSTLDLSRLLGRILDAAVEAVPAADRVWLGLIDQPGNRSNRLAELELNDRRIFRISSAVLPASVFQVLNYSRAILIANVEEETVLRPLIPDNGVRDSIRSAAVAPLVMGREVAGALLLGSTSLAAFDESTRGPVATFASTATAALQNAIIYSETRELASRDPLTGVFNRRTLFEMGQREVERARRFERPLTAIMFDVDHFKDVNDRHGHAAGDEVLTAVVDRCRTSIRHVDILARYGGDEFAILLPEANEDLALEIAHRVRSSVSGSAVPTNDGPVLVSISMGLASLASETTDLASMLSRADQALYRSKQSGRDAITVFS